MIESIILIGALSMAVILLLPTKKEKRVTREHNSTDMARCAEDIALHLQTSRNEEQLKSARRLVELFKEWYGNEYQAAKDYDGLCVVYHQQKARLAHREIDLTSELLDLNEYPVL